MASILVVDDDRSTLDLVRELLQGGEHRVLVAQHGPDAIVAAARNLPELVIADLCMPGMDAFSFLRLLREHTRCRDTSAVFMSATLDEREARARSAGRAGAPVYIPKPIKPQELLDAVAEALAARQERFA